MRFALSMDFLITYGGVLYQLSGQFDGCIYSAITAH